MAKEECLSRNLIYKGRIIDVYVDEVLLENGNAALREVVEHSGGAAIVAISEEKKIALVKQYRYAQQCFMLELPAGKIDKGESMLECASRELEEETGYIADVIEEIAIITPSPAYVSEKIYIFLAKGLKKGKSRLDDDEFLSLMEIPFSEALDMVEQGIITDSKTIIGILKCKDYVQQM